VTRKYREKKGRRLPESGGYLNFKKNRRFSFNRFEGQRPAGFWVLKIIRNEEPSVPVILKILQ
jgi:hypothetical protein